VSGPLIIGINGLSLDSSTQAQLLHPAIGGVILFSRNYDDLEQLRQLTEQIRSLDRPRLVLMVDQEGGAVQRFQQQFTRLPPLAALGRWYTSHPHRALDMAYRHARVMAAEVLAAGLDMSLAPVLDLQGISEVIGSRAFSSDPDAVFDLAGHYLAGMRDAGMASCGKHFPGHGSVQADSHHQQVTDSRTSTEIERDIEPFRRLLAQLDSLMPAHVCYQQVDKEPAGFSEVWLNDVLRRDMSYQGIIISDDLDMAGASTAGEPLQRLQACLNAGCDLALVCAPESVAKLLSSLDDSGLQLPDCSNLIERLYGRPSFSLEEQLLVPEFRSWRESLNALAEQSHG